MAKPRVFISSTFYDLKHIRSSIENFIDLLGYETILSEKGNITYNPEIPLDESCYREVQNCDIFVLLIGGRYGTPINLESKNNSTDFYRRYESITKHEYEKAVKNSIPIYVLIEKSVYSEYNTFKNNKDNQTINYAHVDSVNIFTFIDKIINQPKNNPIHQFEKHSEIEIWLKQQWAGLFQELISKRKIQTEISELSKEIKDLSNITTTMKRYLEEIVSTTESINGKGIIVEEENRLKTKRMMDKFLGHHMVIDLQEIKMMKTEDIIELISKPKTFRELAADFALYVEGQLDGGNKIYNSWKSNYIIQDKFNELRFYLGLIPLEMIK